MVTAGLPRLAWRSKRPQWSPYTADGQTGLADMVSALKHIPNRNDNLTAANSLKDATPESPAERRFRSRGHIPKSAPLPEHESRYANNPWAQMLASSLRYCQGSRIRFPIALLTEYTMHTDPVGSQIYLLPANLADLARFKADLNSDDPVTAIINRKYEGNAGRTTRVLSYDFLLESMTNKFQAWDNKTQRSETKPGEVSGRLVPPRWAMAAQKMRDYRNASKEYFEEVNVRKTEGEEGLEDVLEERQPVSLNALHWKPDIVQRIANAMRMRIIVALDEVLRHGAASEQTIQMSMPEASILYTTGAHSKGSPDIQEFWNDMGDIEAPSALSATALPNGINRQGNPFDARPPIAVRPDEISQEIPPPNLPAGTIILHTGSPSEFQLMLEKRHSQQEAHSSTTNAYIPPTLLINNTHHPIFNIQSLLTPALQPELSRILSLNDSKSLLLIKATSPQATVLTHEIWQLWRFQGGTAGQQTPLGAPPADATPTKTNGNTNIVKQNQERTASISAMQKRHLYAVMGWEGTSDESPI